MPHPIPVDELGHEFERLRAERDEKPAGDERERPYIRLARIVGMEDANSDYVGSRVLECLLFYDGAQIAPEVRRGCVQAWLYPDVVPAGVRTFVEQATATAAFRLLVERCEPTEISAPPA